MKHSRPNWYIIALVYVTLLLALAACTPLQSSTLNKASIGIGADGNSPSRIYVAESAIFQDAQYEMRTVLILRDRKTGHEYLAVQGFGVTDMTTECTSDGETTTCEKVED